jgi:broad specificity phosphatase PhoE
LPIIQYKELNELNRDNEKYLINYEYHNYVKRTLLNINTSIGKWESGRSALKRYVRKIDEIDNQYSNKKILVVAHGLGINLYFGTLLDRVDILYERWKATTFCDYGIIKKSKVVKDITKK